jgi:Fe-S-cluster-containing dehydrogenase component
MSMKWNLIIDVALCENCSNCVLAAKDELVGNDFPGYSAPHAAHGPGVIRVERHVRGAAPMVDVAHVPRLCNHCDDAPCVKAGQGAVKKRPDGIVIVDPVAAKGRRELVASCPYGAMVWNEARQLAQTWFFDAHLLDAGAAAPRCVGVCPTQAMTALKCDDATMAARAAAEGLRTLRPELGTKPRVHYRNLQRADHCFVGGSAVAVVNGRLECVEGVQVVLHGSGVGELGRTRSDAFGDFRFDALAPGSGSYRVSLQHAAHGGAEREFTLGGDSIVLGEIELQ